MTTREKVAAMTDEQCRARLAEISAMSKRGDYSWEFDEYVIICDRLPEERKAIEAAENRQRRRAINRRYR